MTTETDNDDELTRPALAATDAPRVARLRLIASTLPALGAYAAGSAALWTHVLRHLTGSTYGGNDAYLITWWLRWTPFALLHGHLPFRTGWLGHPHGVNAMWNTSVLVLGALMSPVTQTAGPLVSYNVLMMAAPALSAWSCYLLARKLFGNGLPAFLAGLLYGFSPYFVGQSAGHLQMTWAVFPVVLTWLTLEMVVFQRWSSRRLGVTLGIVTGLQLGVSEEVLASSAVMAAATVTVLALMRREAAADRFPYAARALAIAVGVGVVIDALPLYVQFFGPQRVSGQVQAQAPGADLLSFVIPGPLQAWRFPGSGHLVSQVLGTNLSEQTAFIGLPALVLLAWATASSRRTANALFAVPLTIAVVLCLGRELIVGGTRTGVPLPADLFAHVPVLQSMLPVRFSLYVFLFAALLLAGWASTASPSHRGVRTALAAATLVTLTPHQLPAFAVSVPPFFRGGYANTHIRPASAAFVAPYPGPGIAAGMLWQAEADLRFRMVGGYFLGPDRHGRAVFGQPPGALAQILSAISKGKAPPTAQSAAAAVRDEVVLEHIDEVIIGPMRGADAAAHFVSTVLKVKARRVGGIWLLKVRS